MEDDAAVDVDRLGRDEGSVVGCKKVHRPGSVLRPRQAD
jgi:hypothetical protein